MARSERIRFLASLLKGFETVLDVGSDHGLVLKEAILTHGVTHGIASDIRKQPLMQAQKNLKGLPVTFVLSDGFKAIKDPFDCAVIAGMGAYLMTEIMQEAPLKEAVTYLLQANEKIDVLRRYLSQNGFRITDEHVIFDGRYYVILVVKRGTSLLTEEDIILGPILKAKASSIPYYQFRSKVLKKIMATADEETKTRLTSIFTLFQDAIGRMS
jgi:tRNA (adenine22-N1)-methyltransferase